MGGGEFPGFVPFSSKCYRLQAEIILLREKHGSQLKCICMWGGRRRNKEAAHFKRRRIQNLCSSSTPFFSASRFCLEKATQQHPKGKPRVGPHLLANSTGGGGHADQTDGGPFSTSPRANRKVPPLPYPFITSLKLLAIPYLLTVELTAVFLSVN